MFWHVSDRAVSIVFWHVSARAAVFQVYMCGTWMGSGTLTSSVPTVQSTRAIVIRDLCVSCSSRLRDWPWPQGPSTAMSLANMKSTSPTCLAMTKYCPWIRVSWWHQYCVNSRPASTVVLDLMLYCLYYHKISKGVFYDVTRCGDWGDVCEAGP